MRVCQDCHKVVSAVDVVEIGGKYYHRACRTCAECGKLISSKPEMFMGKPYHSFCLHSPKTCYVCGKPTTDYVVDFWGNKACTEHAIMCHYCGRFHAPITQGGRMIDHSYYLDGKRKVDKVPICTVCEQSIVKTSQDIERCRKNVMTIFNSYGIEGIPQDIPILLSDMVAEGEKYKGGFWGLNYGNVSPSREKYSFHITIHAGLPELLFKGVLAHELLHSWLDMYAINLPQNEKEGFCNLGQNLVLRQEKSKAAEYLITCTLEKNPDPIYGEGYRLMKKRLDKLGWKGLMNAILWDNKKH